MDEIINDWNENATDREERNFLYIRSLKFKEPDRVDRIAKELHEEAFEKIDCLNCGNCCKVSKPVLYINDIKRIAEHLGIGIEEAKSTYMEKDKDGDWTFNALPCPFLNKDNSCQIYSHRPDDCHEFPHTYKEGFASRSYQHSWNTTVCPAVYYIVERMKRVI